MFKTYPSDLAELKQIWKMIFKDTDEYIDLYFKERFSPDKTYVLRDKEKITSTLYYSDVKLYHKEDIYNCAYICGIATLPEYRGKKQASTLIDACLKDLKAKGYDIAFLIPASHSLFDFYKGCGFENFTSLNILSSEIVPSCDEYSPRKDTDIKNLYEDFIGLKPLRTDKDFEVLNSCYGLPYTFSDGYIYAYQEKETLYVVEHSFKKLTDLMERINIIADKSINNAVIKSPSDAQFGETTPFSVYVNFKSIELPKEKYINLMLN